jgi:hypothetical protein
MEKMSKFPLIFLAGVIFILLIAGFLILAKNNQLGIMIKPLATVKEALFDLFTFSEPEIVNLPIVEKEDSKEKENIKEEENLQKEPDISSEPNIDEIVEKLDEISEKIDLLTQEVEKLLGKEIEKEDENEVSEEEKLEEVEDESEQIVEEAKTPEKDIVLCEKGGQSPVRDKIILNEISWMGTNSDWRNEWIELKNISNSEISLKNWQILDKNEEIKIIFEEKDKILVNQLFLLERTNDDSVPNVSADKIYSGNLNDEDEILYLFDENCQLQDEILALPNWPAGDKNERKSMERDSGFSWYTYFGGSNYGIFGTPKAENSPKFVFSSSGGGLPPPEEEIPVVPPLKILISEIFFDAEGSDEEQEFIELFNPNDSEVDLSSHSIQYLSSSADSIDKIEKKNFEEGNKIEAKSYFLLGLNGKEGDLKWSQSLGNNGGSIILADNKEKITGVDDLNIVDRVGYGTGEGLILAETSAISLENFEAGKSLGRKWLEETEEYQDLDNNQEDFEIQESSPKDRNLTIIIPEVIDNVPPQISFDNLFFLQVETSFSLYWVGQDLAPENVTPSEIEGFLLRYSEDKENWTYWPSETEYTQETQYPFKGEDEKIYYFQIKAKDKVGNESDWSEILIEINTRPIVINEVYYDVDEREAGEKKEEEGDNEWIEIYNLANWSINISGWIIEDNGGISKQKIIPDSPDVPAKGFAIIAPFESTWLYWVIPDTILKITLDSKIGSYGLSNEGDRVILKEPTGKEIDAMSYEDDITIFELLIAAKEGESLARQIVGYDTDTASDWQILNMPTPGQ